MYFVEKSGVKMMKRRENVKTIRFILHFVLCWEGWCKDNEEKIKCKNN